FVFEQDRDGRSDGCPVTHTRQDMSLIGLDLHPSAAAKTLLAAPQLTVKKGLVHLQTGRQSRQKGNQRLSMRLPRSEVTKHCFGIVSDAMDFAENRELTSEN